MAYSDDSTEAGCFNFIVKKGHSADYAKDFLYKEKLSIFGGMTAEKCIQELLRKKYIKSEEEGWRLIRSTLQRIFH